MPHQRTTFALLVTCLLFPCLGCSPGEGPAPTGGSGEPTQGPNAAHQDLADPIVARRAQTQVSASELYAVIGWRALQLEDPPWPGDLAWLTDEHLAEHATEALRWKRLQEEAERLDYTFDEATWETERAAFPHADLRGIPNDRVADLLGTPWRESAEAELNRRLLERLTWSRWVEEHGDPMSEEELDAHIREQAAQVRVEVIRVDNDPDPARIDALLVERADAIDAYYAQNLAQRFTQAAVRVREALVITSGELVHARAFAEQVSGWVEELGTRAAFAQALSNPPDTVTVYEGGRTEGADLEGRVVSVQLIPQDVGFVVEVVREVQEERVLPLDGRTRRTIARIFAQEEGLSEQSAARVRALHSAMEQGPEARDAFVRQHNLFYVETPGFSRRTGGIVPGVGDYPEMIPRIFAELHTPGQRLDPDFLAAEAVFVVQLVERMEPSGERLEQWRAMTRRAQAFAIGGTRWSELLHAWEEEHPLDFDAAAFRAVVLRAWEAAGGAPEARPTPLQ